MSKNGYVYVSQAKDGENGDGKVEGRPLKPEASMMIAKYREKDEDVKSRLMEPEATAIACVPEDTSISHDRKRPGTSFAVCVLVHSDHEALKDQRCRRHHDDSRFFRYLHNVYFQNNASYGTGYVNGP
jgi:hypothetical protein